MKRIAFVVALFLCFLPLVSYAQMTDDQVIEYVKAATAAGKSRSAIEKELLLRGVTQEQADRIRESLESQQDEVGNEDRAFGEENDYVRNSGNVTRSGRGSKSNRQNVQLPKKSRRNVNVDKNRDRSNFDIQRDQLTREARKTTDFTELMKSLDDDSKWVEIPDSLRIFGHDVFAGGALSFEPNENLATPENYQLGPGDQLLIEVFGYSEGSYSKTISPEGNINISQIGQVQLGGLTIKEAKEKLRRALVSKYASIGGSNPNTTISITLRNIRTIQVNIMGEVEIPGTFRLSPFATVLNALYHAGGVKEEGSLRTIKVIRGGELYTTVDVYGYLFNGYSDSDITLKEGDVIIVQPYVNLVLASGNFKRPMFYELAEGETLSDLIQYAGGFSSKAYQDDFRVIRRQGAERQIYTVRKDAVSSFVMVDGDEVYVDKTLERFANKVEIKGAVFRPGMYELGGDIATVRQLVRAAGGLMEDAFTGRAVIIREKEDRSFESLSVDLAGILSGSANDIALYKNDILSISSQKDMYDMGTLTINGFVKVPGVFPYTANTTIEDLILMAGGLMDGASTVRVDVARRLVDPTSTVVSEKLGETFSFALKDGFVVDEGERFTLQPFDVVSVRRSPGFKVQQFVKIDGEVPFPGDYVLLDEGERVSDLIRRAGGYTNMAYLRGSTLTRRLTEEEANIQNSIQSMVSRGSMRDTLKVKQLHEGDMYTVGIEIDKALERPGSEYDLILREGDRIVVPEKLTTVRISGNVLYPNTVTFVPGKPVSYYISSAGGYGFRAQRSKTYIVYLNGNISVVGIGGAKVEPGCEIIVPQRPERKGMSASEVLSIGTSTASLATMVISVINMLKK